MFLFENEAGILQPWVIVFQIYLHVEMVLSKFLKQCCEKGQKKEEDEENERMCGWRVRF